MYIQQREIRETELRQQACTGNSVLRSSMCAVRASNRFPRRQVQEHKQARSRSVLINRPITYRCWQLSMGYVTQSLHGICSSSSTTDS